MRTFGAMCVLLTATAFVPSLQGQQPLRKRDRVGVSVNGGLQFPAGASEVQDLLQRALVGGSRATRPAIAGTALHIRVTPRWSLTGAGEFGRRQTATVSRVAPTGVESVQQNTDYRVVYSALAGVEWEALNFRHRDRAEPTRVREYLQLRFTAGAGTTEYSLHQWGNFVDETRLAAFSAELWSRGRGQFAYLGAALDIPIFRGVIVRVDVRESRGEAPMSADFAEFQRIDIGGTRVGGGLIVYPGSWWARR